MRYEAMIRSNFKVSSVSGQEFLCHCPWHNDTSSGHLYINGTKGLYLCMSCGAKGSLDTMQIEKPIVSTDDVRERLAAYRNRAKMSDVHYYPESWLKQYDVPHPYWTEDRELPESVVRRFGLGYDPFSDRCTLPLRDVHGRILGVTYRRLDDGKPKYLHPKGFPIGRHLYGAWLLSHETTVALVEGQVDAIRCWASRVPALSLMGSRITKDQVKVLQRANVRTVVLMLDNDAAGRRGTIACHEMLHGTGIRVKVGWYRPYWRNVKDPDALNPQRLRKMYHSAVSITDWAEMLMENDVA